MVKPLLSAVFLFLAASCASPTRFAELERAKVVAQAYLMQHRCPLPRDYVLTAAYYRVEPQSALQFPVYGVEVYPRGEKTILYDVAVDPRSWKVVSFGNNSGIPMPWMFDEPRYETL
jgi:hypothetical protein